MFNKILTMSKKFMVFLIVLLLMIFMRVILYDSSFSLLNDISDGIYSGSFLSLFNFGNCSAKLPGWSLCPKSYKYYTPLLSTLYLQPFRSGKLNISDLETHPNFSPIFLKSKKLSSLIPDIQRIRWSGVHWQESWRYPPKFLLYSAHFDNRETVIPQENGCVNTYVRILGVYDGTQIPAKHSCLLWFKENDPPVMTPVYKYDLIDWQGFGSNHLTPYLISCLVPSIEGEIKFPIGVSLVQNTCQLPCNFLHVTGKPVQPKPASYNVSENQGDKEGKRNDISVGVCGPALYYYNDDFSHRLVEWIEILLMYGASKLFIYKTDNHKNVEKILQYYQDIGKMKIISFHYPPPYLDEPSLRRAWTKAQRKEIFALENIYFTDCVLRFKDEFQYLAHFDPDEVPILKNHQTLPELIKYLSQIDSNGNPSSYFLRWKTFYSNAPSGPSAADIPNNFYILSHNQYMKYFVNPIDHNGKSIYDTKQTLAVYSHEPLLILKGSSKRSPLIVKESVAYTAHYREQKCPSHCSDLLLAQENALVNRKEEIISRVNYVLKTLNL